MRAFGGIVLFLCVVALAIVLWATWDTITDKIHNQIDKNESTVTTPTDGEQSDDEKTLEDSGIQIELEII